MGLATAASSKIVYSTDDVTRTVLQKENAMQRPEQWVQSMAKWIYLLGQVIEVE